jgi:hypothetical protein
MLLDLFDNFSRYFFAAFRGVVMSSVLRRQAPKSAAAENGNNLGNVEQQMQSRLRHCLVDSLFFFLDGLERLSLHRETSRIDVVWGKARGQGAGSKGGQLEMWKGSDSTSVKRHGVDSSRLVSLATREVWCFPYR